MPARQYPATYAVAVQGGTVRSAGRTLRVAACPGVDRVAVTITPAGTSSATCATAPAPGRAALKLALTVSPRTVRAGRRATVKVLVRVGRRAVRGARVHLAGAHATTDGRGRARIRKRFVRPGLRLATARATGFTTGRARVRVVSR